MSNDEIIGEKEEKYAERRNALDTTAFIDLYFRRKRKSDDGKPDLDHTRAVLPGRGKSNDGKQRRLPESAISRTKELFLFQDGSQSLLQDFEQNVKCKVEDHENDGYPDVDHEILTPIGESIHDGKVTEGEPDGVKGREE